MSNSVISAIPSLPEGNRVIFDWLSFTTRVHSLSDLVDLIGMRGVPREVVNGSKGYRNRMYYCGVSIHYNDEDTLPGGSGNFIWLEMSGQGCRTFETMGTGDYESLFSLARRDPDYIHVTRLDVAFDDMTDIFDIRTIVDYTRLEQFTSRQKRYEAIYSNKGCSANFGSKGSNVFIRIYDKAAERGYTPEQVPHWVRCELQLRDNNAFAFICQLPGRELGRLYLEVLKNYLIFREPSDTDSNKRRWDVAPWWDAFLSNVEAVSLFEKPGMDYNLSACERYVMTQPLGSIRTLMKIFGAPAFVRMVMEAPPSKNPKYQRLIAECSMKNTDEAFIEMLEKRVYDKEFLEEIGESYREIEAAARRKRSLFVEERKRSLADLYLKNHGLDLSKK